MLTIIIFFSKFNFIFPFSEENQIQTSNFVQNLLALDTSRVFVYFFIGLSAGPLGLIISFGFLCAIILTSLLLPIWIGPFCFSVCVTVIAYLVWKIVCIMLEIAESFEDSIKQVFKNCTKWFFNNAQRTPFSSSSVSSLSESLDFGKDESENGENELLDVSSDENEVKMQPDVRQLNVRSVSKNV